MHKTNFKAAALLILSAVFSACVQNAKPPELNNEYSDDNQKIVCEILVEQNKPANDTSLTATFLGALDSRIHGYRGNLFEMTPQQREPYVQEAIEKNPRQPAHLIKAMFEKPYVQYKNLPNREKKSFLIEKLQKAHRLSPEQLSGFIASCE